MNDSSSTLERIAWLWSQRWGDSIIEKIVRIVPTVIYMTAIFYFSSIPGDQLWLPPGADDRLLHFLGYFGLGLLLMLSAAGFVTHRVSAGEFLISGVIGILYGVTDEWHQSFVPRRDVSVADTVFDAAGVVAALVFLYLFLRRLLPR